MNSTIKLRTYQQIYMAALAFVGLIAAAFFYWNAKSIEKNQIYASIINTAGKQRMLSQRSSLLALNNSENSDLMAIIEEMRISQKSLSCTELAIACNKDLDKEIENLLAKHINILNNTEKNQLKQYIDFELNLFLDVLNQRVIFFETKAKQHTKNIILMEQLIVLILLVILFLEAVFIFRPILNGMHIQILAAKSSEKKAKTALQQNEKLLGSISHYFKTPLNQMLFEINKLKNTDNKKLLDSFNHLQNSLKHILDFYKTDEDRVLKLVNSNIIENKLPKSTKQHITHFQAKTLKIDESSLMDLLTASVDLAQELDLQISIRLDDTLQLFFSGEQERLLSLKSTSENQLIYNTLALSRWLKELYRFPHQLSISDYGLTYSIKLEEYHLREKQERKRIEKVLIVDDQKINIKILALKLKKLGLEYISASNGLEAIEKCDNKIDLILLDIKMPVMDGLEAAKELKKQFPEIPIVFVSANDFPRDIISAMESGGSSFISKPVSELDLIDEINFFENYQEETRIFWNKKKSS